MTDVETLEQRLENHLLEILYIVEELNLIKKDIDAAANPEFTVMLWEDLRKVYNEFEDMVEDGVKYLERYMERCKETDTPPDLAYFALLKTMRSHKREQC
jgi:hypothetical protein